MPINVAVQMWPTPDARDSQPGGLAAEQRRYERYSTIGLQAAAILWPTPNADNAVGGRNYKDDGTKYRPNSTYGMTLVDAAALWMTPNACDENGGKVARPGKTNTRMSPSGKKQQLALKQQVREIEAASAWPTPQSRDGKGKSGPNHQYALQLPDKVPGTLNPAWVECLQGLPVGWTDTTVTDLNASNALANIHGWPSRPSEPQHPWEPPRVTTGKQPKRQQRLKALGNLAIPEQFADVFAAIVAADAKLHENAVEKPEKPPVRRRKKAQP